MVNVVGGGLTLTRIIKSVVTEQAAVTLGWRDIPNAPGKKHKPTVVHAYIIADLYQGGIDDLSEVCNIIYILAIRQSICNFCAVFYVLRREHNIFGLEDSTQ